MAAGRSTGSQDIRTQGGSVRRAPLKIQEWEAGVGARVGKVGVGTKGWILDIRGRQSQQDFLAHDLSGVSNRRQERPQSIWSRETVRQELPLTEMEKYDIQYFK